MTVRPRVFGLALVALLLVAPKSHASTILIANLTNSQEPGNIVPTLSPANGGGPRPVSFGTATFVLNDAQTAMTFIATIFNIDVTGTQTADTFDNLTAAHIHAGPNIAPVTNGVVWGFFGAPFNDNNPNDFSFTPFATGVGGTFFGKWDLPEGNGVTNGVPNNLANQLPFILSGQAYINFHTTQFGGGEIRGALLAAPEPGTWLLVGGGLALMLRRRFARR
jgi:hypothetical protein